MGPDLFVGVTKKGFTTGRPEGALLRSPLLARAMEKAPTCGGSSGTGQDEGAVFVAEMTSRVERDREEGRGEEELP